MKIILKQFISIFLFFCIQPNFVQCHGFVAGTLVKVHEGYKKIEEIEHGDNIICQDQNGNQVQSIIEEISCKKVSKFLEIFIDDELLQTTLEQKFYSPIKRNWLKAKNISLADNLKSSLENLGISGIKIINEEKIIYFLTVKDHHNFFVSKKDILVHNFAILIPIATWTFGEGVQYVTASTIAAAVTAYAICSTAERSGADVYGVVDLTENQQNKKSGDDKKITNKEAREKAKEIGATETKDYDFNSHGQLVFKHKGKYLSPDKDRHKGGFWKILDKNGNRESTMDADLKKIIGK